MQTCVILLCLATLGAGQMYDRLYKDLVKRGAEHTIPVKSMFDNFTVTMSLNMIQVNSLDPESGDASLEVWTFFSWKDERLTWSPGHHNNVTQVHMPHARVWTPDIVLYNGVANVREYLTVLSNDGTIFWVPTVHVKSRCDVSNYTDDGTVVCSFKFGSWTYNGNLLNLVFMEGKPVDVSEYIPGRWDLDSYDSVRNVKKYECCPEPYIDLSYSFVFRDTHRETGWTIFSK